MLSTSAVQRATTKFDGVCRFLYAAYEFVSDTADDAGHGSRDHRSLLDDARTVVISCAAVALGTTEATVKLHRGKVMHKMQAQSLADLIRMAGKLSP